MHNIGKHGLPKEKNGLLKENYELLKEIETLMVDLVDYELISYLQSGLIHNKMIIIKNLIHFIDNLLNAAERLGLDITEKFYETGCFQSIENSQLYADKETQSKILNIFGEHFGIEDQLSDYSPESEFF